MIDMDVCIIGGGWSGIYAGKYALENGLRPIVLERRSDIGGVWNYSDDPSITTVMKSTISSSSRLVTEASDFFMDESVGHFMHHTDVMQYLRDYIQHFQLGPHIQLGASVQSVTKHDGQWLVTYCQHGRTKTVRSPRLAVCTGVNSRKKAIGAPICHFTGAVIHAGDIKHIEPTDYSENDHILVYGGGETASDVIDLLVDTPARITWAIRGGQHFLRKTWFARRPKVGLFDKHDFALDTMAAPLITAVSSFVKGAPGRRYMADYLSTGSIAGYQGHGVRLWRNQYHYGQMFINKNGHTVDHTATGRVATQNEVIDVSGDIVHFKSGDHGRFTHIICCFGYEFHCPFLPEPHSRGDLASNYHFIFPPHDSSIAFLGYARPIIGSIPMMTEMQCLYAFRVWSGKVELPNERQMKARQHANNQRWGVRIPGRRNMKTLVLPSTYFAKMIKAAYPDRSPGDHFVKSPLRGLKFLTWKASGSMRLALDPNLSRQEFNRLWRMRSHGFFLGWLMPAIVAISRLLRIQKLVDWYVERTDERRQATMKQRADQWTWQACPGQDIPQPSSLESHDAKHRKAA